jgi:hypothetical protein
VDVLYKSGSEECVQSYMEWGDYLLSLSDNLKMADASYLVVDIGNKVQSHSSY